MAFNTFTDMSVHVNDALSQYVGETATNVTIGIKPVAVSLVTLVITFWGWAMMRGVIQYPVMDAVKNGLKLIFTVAVATQIGHYNEFVSGWLWQMPDALANLVIHANGGSTGKLTDGVTFSFLDEMLSKFFDNGADFWEQASLIHGSGFIIALVVWAFGIAITCYIAYLMLLSKISLAVLLGIGPIFIMLTLFDTTKKFFDTWIGFVMNAVFLNMLIAAVGGLMLGIISSSMPAKDTADYLSISEAFQLIVICGASVPILWQVPSWAAALGGGVAINTLNSFKYGVDKALGGPKDVYKAGKWGHGKYQDFRKNSIKRGEE